MALVHRMGSGKTQAARTRRALACASDSREMDPAGTVGAGACFPTGGSREQKTVRSRARWSCPLPRGKTRPRSPPARPSVIVSGARPTEAGGCRPGRGERHACWQRGCAPGASLIAGLINRRRQGDRLRCRTRPQRGPRPETKGSRSRRVPPPIPRWSSCGRPPRPQVERPGLLAASGTPAAERV